MLIRCSTAETLTDGCGCFRLRSSDVSESPMICGETETNAGSLNRFMSRYPDKVSLQSPVLLPYLIFPTAHGQREELMEEMFLLGAADVGHMTCEDAVQSSTVPDKGQTHS